MKYLKKINLKTLFCITIITVIISTFFSLASYRSALSGIGKGQVATVALGIDNETTLNLPIGPLDSDDEQSFEFEVLNKSNNRKNEVTMKYYIEIINDYANLPLNFSIYQLNKNNQYELLPLNLNKTKESYLGYSEDMSDKYKLIISWNKNAENYNDYKFSKSIDLIKIKVVSEQID